MEKLPHILYIARDDGGCGFYRCKQPSNFLNRSGLARSTVLLNKATHEQLLSADLVVMQEMGTIEAMSIGKFLSEHKIPFMLEFDDFLHHVSPHNLGGHGAWNPSTLYVHRSMELLRRASAATVSTNQMAREYFPYNNLLYVVPNFLDKDRWDVPLTRRTDNKIRIGWCGGNAHGDDLHMVSKVIERVTKEYDGKVVFETMGMTRQELVGVFPMNSKESTEPCEKCGHEGILHHHSGESYDNMPQVLAGRGWDIAIAPVIDNSFGNCKSDLKIKEYSAIGYPVVASPIVPYRESAKDGASISFAETHDEWYAALKTLIENPAQRTDMARHNKEWIAGKWIQDRIPDIFAVYEDVMLRYAQVHGERVAQKLL